MKKYLIILLICCLAVSVNGQKLEIAGATPNLYLKHTVAPQETFYSIGRLYNVAPRALATFNNLSLDKGLTIDQPIRIPLDKNNFSQSEVKSVLDFYLPLYHTVKQGETLYRVSVNYNKVPLESLKQWNSMSSETVSTGMEMIVGYLKVDKSQSAFAQRGATEMVSATVAANRSQEGPATPTVRPDKNTNASPVISETEVEPVPANPAGATAKEGFFKSYYLPSSFNQKSGTAATFKSTSGWQDAKYYCFMNEAAPGSIVKITDNESGKSVYARVLDAIPDIKQNNGVLVILSNSGMDALGRGEDQFTCTVFY